MSLMRPFSSIREDMNRLFREMEQEFQAPQRAKAGAERPELPGLWGPPVDIIEEGDNIKVKAQVPGVKPEDIEIEVENDTLLLSGETRYTTEEDRGNVHLREIATGQFFRRIPLPTDVQGDKAKAEFQEGMLTITLPKSAEVRRHKIKVSR